MRLQSTKILPAVDFIWWGEALDEPWWPPEKTARGGRCPHRENFSRTTAGLVALLGKNARVAWRLNRTRKKLSRATQREPRHAHRIHGRHRPPRPENMWTRSSCSRRLHAARAVSRRPAGGRTPREPRTAELARLLQPRVQLLAHGQFDRAVAALEKALSLGLPRIFACCQGSRPKKLAPNRLRCSQGKIQRLKKKAG